MTSRPLKCLTLILTFCFGAFPITSGARSMLDIPGLPVAGLRTYLPPEAYARLINAPVKAYIQVRGQVVNNKVFGARVTHSEYNGVFDKVAVQMANHMEVYSDIAGTNVPATVSIHVLIYGLPDKSEDALAVAQNDTVGAANLVYSRSIMLRHLGLANQQPAAKKKK
jgi:hypothetical protein